MAETIRERAGQILNSIVESLHRRPEGVRAGTAIDVDGSRSPQTDVVDHAEIRSDPAAILDDAIELAWSEIVTHLRATPPNELHQLVTSLLRAMGYHAPSIAPPGTDGSVDMVAFTDPLAGRVERVKVRILPPDAGQVGVADVRDFVDVVGVGDVGLLVALDGYSSDAEAEASSHDALRITLLDFAGVFELWVEHYDQLSADARRHLPLRPVHFLDPEQLS